MHAGNPEDGVAEGGMYVHNQLPQSMRLRDREVMSNPVGGLTHGISPRTPQTPHRGALTKTF